jgi:hypothetical protein
MIVGPVRGKNSEMPCPLVVPVSPLKMCECVQTFKTAIEVPFHAVWVGV